MLYLSVFSSSVRSSRVGHCVQCCICLSSLLLSAHHVLVTVSSAVSVSSLLLFTHHVLVTVSSAVSVRLLFFCSLITCWSLCPVLYLCLLFFCSLIACWSLCPVLYLSSLLLSAHRVLVTVSSAVSVCLLFFCHSSRVGHCVQCCICLSSLLLSLITCWSLCPVRDLSVFSSSVHSSRVGHCVQCCICRLLFFCPLITCLVTVSSAVSVRLLFFCPLITCWSLCPVACILPSSTSSVPHHVLVTVSVLYCRLLFFCHSSRVGHCVQCCIGPSSLLLSHSSVLVTVSSAVSVCLLFFCPLITCWSLCPVLYLSVFSSSVHSSRVGHCVQCCICVFSSSVHSSRVGHCVQCRVCLSSLLLSTHHMLVTVSSAVSVGTEMLEMDCHLTSDGCVVVSHDNNLLRQTGYDKTVSSLRFQVFILTNKPALFISI